jgi:adhesin transport system membrane fusion protein
MAKPRRDDLDFAREYHAARYRGPHRSSIVLLSVVASMFTIFLTWAYFAEIDEVARGEGQVVPSSRTQVVESLEGGIVKQILVHVGATVAEGETLLHIDDTGFSSNLGELRAQEARLRSQIIRLTAEVSGNDVAILAFPQDLRDRVPSIIASEQQLYDVRQDTRLAQVALLEERLEQRRRELSEAEANAERLTQTLDLARQERDLKQPLADRGIVPRTEMLSLERLIVDISGQLAGTREQIPRLQSAVREVERELDEQRLTFRQLAQTELSDRLTELSVVDESLRAASDRVSRTEVRAPVSGVINQLYVSTIGEVVQAGETLVEIIPLQDMLLVDARITPRDIAFIHPNQPAVVKITAYDFGIYGGLAGLVERISADSSVDEVTNERYYTVTVRTDEADLRDGNEILPIIPGMVASVDIITGKKSVLDYLLKPILKARNEAMRER